MNGEQLLAWSGPDPRRVDTASLRHREHSFTASGTSTTAAHVVDFDLTTGSGWVTRRLVVRVRSGADERQVRLIRSDSGAWSTSHTTADGRWGEAVEHPELDGALDCDLALCPLTNTMPVLRHDLVAAAHRGDTREVRLLMAWVSLPDLTVHASAQTYAAVHPVEPDGAVLSFAADGYATSIEVDGDGFVVSYPALARRIA